MRTQPPQPLPRFRTHAKGGHRRSVSKHQLPFSLALYYSVPPIFPSLPRPVLRRHLWLTQRPACPSSLWCLAGCVFLAAEVALTSSLYKYVCQPATAQVVPSPTLGTRACHRPSESPYRPNDSQRTCLPFGILQDFCAAGARALGTGGHSRPPPFLH